MRAFLAVELSPAVRRGLAAEQERLRPALRGMRWVRPETLHLTLLFLGEVPDAGAPRLGDRAARACDVVSGGSIRVAGRGCFPPRGRVRVVWAGVEDDQGTLGALHGALRGVAVDQGLPVEGRAFSPHLTLGRTRSPMARARVEAALGDAPDLDLGAMPVSECVLFRSTLRPQGAVHDPVRRFRLAAPGEAT